MSELNKDKLLLSWAFSEAFSLRWGENFRCDFNLTDHNRVIQSKDPDQLSTELKQKLVSWLTVRRKKIIDKYIAPSKNFKLVTCPGEDIEKLVVMPEMAWKDQPVTLGEYINMPYDGEILTDARVSAKILEESRADAANFIGYPVIAYDEKLGTNVLVEGYTRCILLISTQKKTKTYQPIQVIICER